MGAVAGSICFSHLMKSTVPGYGVVMTNCANAISAREAAGGGGLEGFRTIARPAENERAEHVYAVLAECPQSIDQFFPRKIEFLVDVLQAFRGHGLNSHQRAFDCAACIASRNSVSSAASMVI